MHVQVNDTYNIPAQHCGTNRKQRFLCSVYAHKVCVVRSHKCDNTDFATGKFFNKITYMSCLHTRQCLQHSYLSIDGILRLAEMAEILMKIQSHPISQDK